MTNEPHDGEGRAGRLDSWKEIAAYLKRDVTTVQRWERREGLPVHRQQHARQGSVYAFVDELERWSESRRVAGTGIPAFSRWWPWMAGVAVLALALGIISVGLFANRRPRERPAPVDIAITAPAGAGFGGAFALSPDGRYLVMVVVSSGERMLWRRALDSRDAVPISGTSGATRPFWSPDGASIGFFSMKVR